MSWFSREKDHTAVVNSDVKLTVKAGQNLLAAGLEAGLAWPHDCRAGMCGTCQCYLRKGKIKPLADFSFVLDSDQLADGMILACQSQLRSDVEIEVKFDEHPQATIVSCLGSLAKVRQLTHDILELTLSCDKAMPQETMAGQYAEIKLKELDKPRSYSFAKAPVNENPGELTFFVRRVPGGEFTEWLFSEDRVGTQLELNAPYGNFWLREGSGPMICIAGGSGISAVKSILEHAANIQVARDAYFLFGARAQRDLYCREEMQAVKGSWNSAYTFEFVEALSDEPDDSDWAGPRGFVTECLQSLYIDTGKIVPSECQAYLCGPPPMIDAAIALLLKSGVKEESIFYDKFLDASTIPGGR